MAYDNVKEVDSLDVSKEGTEAWEAACRRYLDQSWFIILMHRITIRYVYIPS